MQDKYVYPAIFHYEDDGITISFPDLPGCFSCGDDEEEALFMATDVLGLWMLTLEEDNENIPVASDLNSIKLDDNERTVLIEVWMPKVRKAINNKSIKKTVSIPQ